MRLRRCHETNNRRPVDSGVKRGMCDFGNGGGLVNDKIDIDELKSILSEIVSIDVNINTGLSTGYIEVSVDLYVGDEVVCRAYSDGYINN